MDFCEVAMNKKTYSLSIFSYIAVSVTVFFVLFGTLLLSSAYFSSNQIVTGTIRVGQLDFQILNNLETIDTSEENLFMPDEVINNSITILNARDEIGVDIDGLTPIFLRIKPEFTLNGINSLQFLHIEINNPSNWIEGSDNFLYYTNKLNAGESIVFNDYFILSYLIDNIFQDATAYLGLVVEAVQANNLAYEEVFSTAPQEWKSIVSIL